ncbi:MAG: addiction module protein [Verrucomicrobiales bacterium]|nr:addiction module protein [Verrucomicrobiales bacterium]
MEVALLETEVLKLPERERIKLLERLQDSLANSAIPHLREHLEESKSRFEAYRSGGIEALDGDRAVDSILAEIAR